MSESFYWISKEINDNKEKVNKFDKKIDSQAEIKKFSSNFQKNFKSIQEIKEDIQTLTSAQDKDSLKLQLDSLYADMADLYDDGNINESIVQKTYLEIQQITNEFKDFVETKVSNVRKNILIDVWLERKMSDIAPVNVALKPWLATREKLLFSIDWIPADDIQTWWGDVRFKFYDESIIQQVRNGNINLWQDDARTVKELDWTICCEIVFRDTEPEDIEWIEYETVYIPNEDVPWWEDLPPEDVYGIQWATMIMRVKSFEEIIWDQHKTVEEKYNKVLEIGRNLSTPQEKITFLSSFSIYLNWKYDGNLYEEKKSVFKWFLKNKSVGNNDMLSKDPAWVCADHHRFIATIAEKLWFNAWVISTTSSGLHAITWIKNWDEYVLVDYGSIYTSTSPEDLMAQYYALHSTTPKPFDIVTDANWKTVWKLSTPLWKIIEQHLSPFGDASSADVALNITKNGLQDINSWFDYTVSATNQNQHWKVSYWANNGKHQFSWGVENDNNIDNANITWVNLKHTYQPSPQNEIISNLSWNNTRWDNGNQANALWLSFWYTHVFKPIIIWDAKFNSAITSQWGVQFDTRPKYGYTDGIMTRQPWTIDFSDPINRQAPGFLWNTWYAVSKDIQVGNNADLNLYGSTQWDVLPQEISSPTNTLRIKPTWTLWWNANINWDQRNLSVWWNVSATRYKA